MALLQHPRLLSSMLCIACIGNACPEVEGCIAAHSRHGGGGYQKRACAGGGVANHPPLLYDQILLPPPTLLLPPPPVKNFAKKLHAHPQ